MKSMEKNVLRYDEKKYEHKLFLLSRYDVCEESFRKSLSKNAKTHLYDKKRMWIRDERENASVGYAFTYDFSSQKEKETITGMEGFAVIPAATIGDEIFSFDGTKEKRPYALIAENGEKVYIAENSIPMEDYSVWTVLEKTHRPDNNQYLIIRDEPISYASWMGTEFYNSSIKNLLDSWFKREIPDEIKDSFFTTKLDQSDARGYLKKETFC